MQTQTISVNLDAITNPITIRKRPLAGGTMMPIGDGSIKAMCAYAQQWSSGAEGNMRAKWRRRLNRRKSAKW